MKSCNLYIRPNLEGLLLRLCDGCENQFVSSDRSFQRLRQNWKEYAKPMSAAALNRRFDLADLQRAAKHDGDLQRALTIIGLTKEH